jgi:hypothetical protein
LWVSNRIRIYAIMNARIAIPKRPIGSDISATVMTRENAYERSIRFSRKPKSSLA